MTKYDVMNLYVINYVSMHKNLDRGKWDIGYYLVIGVW